MKLSGYFFDPPHVLGIRPPLIADGEPNGRHQLAAKKVIQFNGERFLESRALYEADRTQGELTYLGHAALFSYRKAKCYAFNRAFLDTLLKTEITRDLHALFPDHFSGYIALPPNSLFMQNDKMPQPAPIPGVYVSVVKPQECFIGGVYGEDLKRILKCDKYLWFTALSDLGDNKHGLVSGQFPIIDNMHNLNDMLDLQLSAAKSNKELLHKMFEAIMLMTIYINTANPDLRSLKPEGHLSKSMKLGMINRGQKQELEENYSNDIVVPVELVSWGWKKRDEYNKEQWEIPARVITYWTGTGRTIPKSQWLPPTIGKRNPALLKKEETTQP